MTSRHDMNSDTLKCQRCGLYAFEAVGRPCNPGRFTGEHEGSASAVPA
jgi:hypothetical protein